MIPPTPPSSAPPPLERQPVPKRKLTNAQMPCFLCGIAVHYDAISTRHSPTFSSEVMFLSLHPRVDKDAHGLRKEPFISVVLDPDGEVVFVMTCSDECTRALLDGAPPAGSACTPSARTCDVAKTAYPIGDAGGAAALDRCDQCDKGRLYPITAAGRYTLDTHGRSVPIPDDLPILTCDHCGARLFDSHAIAAMATAAIADAVGVTRVGIPGVPGVPARKPSP